MRRLLLALMIVLLLLRGWLGDAMAMDLAAPAAQAVAVQAAAAPAHHGATAHHVDAATPAHHEDAQAPANAQHGTEHAADHGHGHCTACQICHSVGATHGGSALPVIAPRHAAPLTGPARFASAEPRLLAKPPIS